MSKVVEQWPALKPHQKYTWDVWFDGQVHVLTRGEDFAVQPESMRHQVYENAVRRGVKVRAQVVGDSVYVQAIGKQRVPMRVMSIETQRRRAAGGE